MASNRAIVVVIAIVAFVIDILSFALPFWSKWDTGIGDWSEGLWQYCFEGTCSSSFDFDNIPDLEANWFNGVRAMETLGMLAGLFATIVIILSSCVQSCRGSTVMGILAKIMCLAAAVLIIIGVIIYGAERESNLHAAFGLAIIAALVYGLTFILLIVMKDVE